MKKKFTFLIAALMLLTLITQPTKAMGQTKTETVYKTALFGSNYNPSNSSYTGSFDATNEGFTVTANHFNNNNNGWTNTTTGLGQIKCGRKNNTSVASIETKAAIDQAITKVVVTIDAITTSKVNSIKLYTRGSSSDDWAESGTYTIASGNQEVNLSSPAANLFYKVEFDCASYSNNGFVTVSKVEYYYEGSSTAYTLLSAVTPTGAGNVSLVKTSLEEDETTTATAIANTHFTFTSWSISGTGASLTSTTSNPTTVTMGTENATVTANFTEDPKYSITYNANYTGSTDDPVVVSDYVGESKTIAAYNTFERSGYFITSWNTAADGSGTPYNEGYSYTITSSNLTLYAQWTAGATGTIVFNSNEVAINSASVTANDDLGNEWTITTAGTSSFTSNAAYYQVGSSSNPATSITFTTTLPSSSVINSFSAKFGGFSSTGGTITLKVGDASVGTGSLSGTSDVVVTNTSSTSGTVLTVTVTSISRGVKCYYISYSYATGSDPIISDAPNSITLGSLATSGEIPYSITNPVSGRSLTATTTADWISGITVASDKVTFTTSVNTSTTEDRTATITLQYEGAADKVVTVTQNKVDYATLPFEYDGNGIYQVPNCFETNLTGSYTDSPKMKFDATGKYLTLHFNESPTSLSYDIKGNGGQSSWAGTFRVETSADGNTWSTLVTYTTLAATTQSFTHVDLATEVRYIRWYYETKSNGNVGLGNIHATAEYDIYGTCTVASLAPTADQKCTIYNGGILNVTGTLTNTSVANLTIENGGQLVCSNSVAATIQKSITAYSDANQKDWYTLSAPVHDGSTDGEGGSISFAHVSNIAPALPEKYNVYWYRESDNMWINSQGSDAFSALGNGIGYIYRSTSEDGIAFAGNTNVSTVTVNLSWENNNTNFKGFNLLGNPYTHDITWSNLTVTPNVETDGYYLLNNEGGWSATASTTAPIAPMTAFLVQASGTNASIAMSNIAPVPNEGKGMNYANDQIMFHVENSEYSDNAFVLFKEGHGLNKVEHRNAEIPMLYVINNGEEFAIADMSDNTGVINLGFEAKTMGQYTISLKAEGQYSYMHLIDKLTGEDTDMLVEDSYTFVGSQSDRNDRFVLRLNYNAAGIDSESDIFAYQNGNDIIVRGEGTLQVFDITGRMVMSTRIDGVETINGIESGVYIFRMEGKTQKIVVR